MPRIDTICWKPRAQNTLSPAELYSIVRTERHGGYFDRLPADEIADAVMTTYQRCKPERVGNTIVWRHQGAIHRVEIEPFCFWYWYEEYPGGGGYTQATGWESIDLLVIAGRFECVVYSPRYDHLVSRPLGMAVRNPITLKSSYQDVEPAVQIPVDSYNVKRDGGLDYWCASIMADAEELEERLGLILEDGLDDLDYLKVALVRIGTQTCLLQQRTYPTKDIDVALPSGTQEPGQFLDTLLAALGLTSESLKWRNEQVCFVEHELWCQNENGSEVMLDKLLCLADALHKMQLLTESGRKNLYWAKPTASNAIP